MFISKYVRKIEFDNNNVLLYNMYNGAIYLIKRDVLKIVNDIELNNLYELDETKKQEIEVLKEQKFLVEKENIVKYK